MNYLTTIAIVAILAIATVFVLRNQPQDVPSNTTIESLLKQLKSEKRDDRVISLFRLAELLTDEDNASDLKYAIPPMVRAIADRDDVVRTASKISLQQIGERASPHLKEFVNSKQFRPYGIGCETIRTLGEDAKMWLPDLHKRLNKLTSKQEDEGYLIATLEAIAGIGHEAKPALDDASKHLEHKNFKVVVAVCKLVSKVGPEAKSHGPRLVILLDEGIPSSRSWASIALGAIGQHDDYDVVDLLSNKLDAFLLIDKQRALEGLALMGPKSNAALDKVEALMKDKSKSAMSHAAYAHWKITGQERQAMNVLTNLMDSRSFGEEAIETIGRFGPTAKAAVPELIKKLKASEPEHRENAIWALGEIGSDANPVVDALEKASSDDDDLLNREIAKIVIKKINKSTSKR